MALDVNANGFHVVEELLRRRPDGLMVQLLLALLDGPLQLPRDDCFVVVALDAISVREKVDANLGR